MHISKCRWCQGDLSLILSLGKLPIVNYFPDQKEKEREKKYPLDLYVCNNCGLVQLGYIISPQKLFTQYHYVTGVSRPLVRHLEQLAKFCIKEFRLDRRSKVLDIGTNDGTFLSNFKKKNIFILGVEPALNIGQKAKEKGISLVTGFFDNRLALKIKNQYGYFDLISATHVLANIVDLRSFLSGVKLLLSENGVFVCEVVSLSRMLKGGYFDSIYHEHYSYFSLSVLKKILQELGLTIFRAEDNLWQGGSLRIFASRNNLNKEPIALEEEISKKDYSHFTQKVIAYKKKIKAFFKTNKNKIIVGFGAPAKAVTFLNFCQLRPEQISFIVDSTSYKQGRFLPGMHLPIYPEEYLRGKKIDYILLLSWNYKKEILKKISQLVSKGTKVIILFPRLTVISI